MSSSKAGTKLHSSLPWLSSSTQRERSGKIEAADPYNSHEAAHRGAISLMSPSEGKLGHRRLSGRARASCGMGPPHRTALRSQFPGLATPPHAAGVHLVAPWISAAWDGNETMTRRRQTVVASRKNRETTLFSGFFSYIPQVPSFKHTVPGPGGAPSEKSARAQIPHVQSTFSFWTESKAMPSKKNSPSRAASAAQAKRRPVRVISGDWGGYWHRKPQRVVRKRPSNGANPGAR